MATAVSSLLDYIQKDSKTPLNFDLIEHELQHVKIREKASSFIAVSSTVLIMLALAGVIGGGMFTVGALAAIAAVAALYATFAREAERSLRAKQVTWLGGSEPVPEKVGNWKDYLYPAGEQKGFLGLGFFSN